MKKRKIMKKMRMKKTKIKIVFNFGKIYIGYIEIRKK